MRAARVLARSALVIGAFATALVAGEVVARFAERRDPSPQIPPAQSCGDLLEFDACTGYWHRANAQCALPHETGPVPVITDQDGLRLPEHLSRASSDRKVAILGDSVTFGWGVQADQTYPALLDRDIDDVAVHNLGLLNGGPDQSLLALRCKELPRFDVIVVAPLVLSVGLFRPYRAYYESSAANLLRAILEAIAQENRDARVIFAPLPTYHYIEYDIPADYERVFREAARASGGDYVDVLAAFKQLGPGERRAARFPVDQHYTASGHAVVAAVLRPAIVAALHTR